MSVLVPVGHFTPPQSCEGEVEATRWAICLVLSAIRFTQEQSAQSPGALAYGSTTH